jgi:hypothetical protein
LVWEFWAVDSLAHNFQNEYIDRKAEKQKVACKPLTSQSCTTKEKKSENNCLHERGEYLLQTCPIDFCTLIVDMNKIGAPSVQGSKIGPSNRMTLFDTNYEYRRLGSQAASMLAPQMKQLRFHQSNHQEPRDAMLIGNACPAGRRCGGLTVV